MVNDSIILVHKNLNLDKRKHLPDKSLKLVVSLYAFLISSPNNSLLNYSQFESGLLFAIWYIQLCGSNFFFFNNMRGKERREISHSYFLKQIWATWGFQAHRCPRSSLGGETSLWEEKLWAASRESTGISWEKVFTNFEKSWRKCSLLTQDTVLY